MGGFFCFVVAVVVVVVSIKRRKAQFNANLQVQQRSATIYGHGKVTMIMSRLVSALESDCDVRLDTARTNTC